MIESTEMLGTSEIDRIVVGAQAAAVDDALWVGWAEGVIRKVGSTGGIFGVVDQAQQTLGRSTAFFESISGYEEYLNGMAVHDPQIKHCMALKRSVVYTDDDHLDLTLPAVRDYMAWQTDKLNFHSHITMTADVGQNQLAAFSIHFSEADRANARKLKAAYRRMMPDVVNAMRLGFGLSELLTESYWQGAQTLVGGTAAILLCERGKIMQANAAAERLFEGRSVFTAKAKRLRCVQPSLDARLQSGIAAALDATQPKGGRIMVSADDTDSPVVVEIFPVHRTRRMMAFSEPGALVSVVKRWDEGANSTGIFADALGLTPAESRAAAYLQIGMADEAIAKRLNVAVSTVRTHVRSILDKTHLSSKAELAHLLTALAATASR